MKTFKEILIMVINESINKTTISSLKKDFGDFTKNVKRIKTVRDYQQVVTSWRVWTKEIERFVFKSLLGDGSDSPINDDDLRKTAWAVVISDGIWLDKVPNYVRYGANINKDDWENMFSYWDDKSQKYVYNKLSRLGRAMFKDLNRVVGEQVILDKHTKDTILINNVKVNILDDESNQADTKIIKDTLKIIKKGLDILGKSKVRDVIKKLTINLEFKKYSKFSGGDYNHNREINMYPIGMNIHTLIHEIGHVWYFEHMSKEQITHWEVYHKDNQLLFSNTDLQEFLIILKKHYDSLEANELIFSQDLLKKIPNKILGYKIESILLADRHDNILDYRKKKQREYQADDEYKEKLELHFGFIKEMLQEEFGNKYILMTPITTYGATQTTESYPEAFALYFTNKTNLHPLTINALEMTF